MNITPLAKTIAAKYRMYEKGWLYVFKNGKVQYLKHAQKTSLANALDTGLIGAIKITDESMTYVRAQEWLNKSIQKQKKVWIPEPTPKTTETQQEKLATETKQIVERKAPKIINRPSYKAKYEETRKINNELIASSRDLLKKYESMQHEKHALQAALQKLDVQTLIKILTNQ